MIPALTTSERICRRRSGSLRLFEWGASSVIFAIGVWLVIWPNALIDSRFYHLAYRCPTWVITDTCLLVGGARLYTLATALRWPPWCGRVRAVCAGVSALIWMQLAVALILDSHPPSISIPVFLMLAAGELITINRARREANGPVRR